LLSQPIITLITSVMHSHVGGWWTVTWAFIFSEA
jgi:hypothetical protein